MEGNNDLDKNCFFYLIKTQMIQDLIHVTAIELDLKKLLIKFTTLLDTQFYNSLEALLIQLELLTPSDDLTTRKVHF